MIKVKVCVLFFNLFNFIVLLFKYVLVEKRRRKKKKNAFYIYIFFHVNIYIYYIELFCVPYLPKYVCSSRAGTWRGHSSCTPPTKHRVHNTENKKQNSFNTNLTEQTI